MVFPPKDTVFRQSLSDVDDGEVQPFWHLIRAVYETVNLISTAGVSWDSFSKWLQERMQRRGSILRKLKGTHMGGIQKMILVIVVEQ